MLLSEKAAEVALPLDAHPVERKAVGGPPAPQVRQPSTDIPRASADQSGSSPESKTKHNKLKKKEVGQGGFRKMFGRNKNRQSTVPSNAPEVLNGQGGSLQPGGANLGRRFSGFAKKSPVVSPMSDTHPASADPNISEDDITPIASPNQAYDRSYDPSVQESLSRVDTNDAHEAQQAFSSFDQGPLEDVPAFVPEDSPRESEDDAAPPNISRVRSSVDDEAGLTKESPVQDRWAQIRKNAAERAAQRQSEEQSRGTYSTKTEGDDGETSGEESK